MISQLREGALNAGRKALLTLMMSFMPFAVQAAELPVPLRQSLEHLAALPGFSCSFEQVLLFSDGSRQNYSGSLAVRRPMRFRWHYTKPYEQLFVSNGSRIWHYEPDLMQVRILRDMEEVDPVVMRLLDGSIGADDVELMEADTAGRRYHVRLGGKNLVWIGLTIAHRLSYVESVDVLGNRNRIRLLGSSEIQPEASEFTFTVPPGVDVLN